MPLGTTEILIIVLAIVVLFGATRLPKAARSLGQSMRIFRAETKGLRSEEETAQQAEQGSSQAPAQQQAIPPAQQKPQVAPPLEQSQGHPDSPR